MTLSEFLPWAALSSSLIIFLGMLALAWRALTIAHDLAKLALQNGIPPKSALPVPSPAPAAPPQVKPTAPPIPAATPVVDAGLVAFIKKEEGFSAKAYWDYKQWTWGYGTKAPGEGATITEADATTQLMVEIDAANKLVTNFVKGLPKGVEQALTDLTYNAGSGWEQGALGAQVKAAVTSGDWSHVKADILQYNHAGGQVLAGLTARREAEVSWFDKPL